MRVEGRDLLALVNSSLVVVCVGLHVAMEITRLGEAEIAHLAAVGLLPAVDPLVLGERRGVSKGFAAVVAPVWPLSRVGSEVSCHGRTLREPFLAYGAAKWLFSAVRPEMCSEVCSLSERLPAYLAVVRLLPAVRAHVSLQGGGPSVTLAADLADVGS